MLYALFIGYTALFCWLIVRLPFFKNTGLPARILVALFLIRVIASLVGSYFNVYYYPFSDSLIFHNEGIKEFQLLWQHPKEYLLNIFYDPHGNDYAGLMSTSKSYWNDTRSNIIIKMLSVFDLFSGSNFFINTLFFNFLVFFGPAALYKTFAPVYRHAKNALITCIFLLPSALLFTSMIHRDGLIFLSLCLVIYYIARMQSNRITAKKIIAVVLLLALIFLLRNFVLLLLLPALTGWLISTRHPRYTLPVFFGIYLVAALLFFGSAWLSPRTDLTKIVAERQQAFLQLAQDGGSTLDVKELHPGIQGFIRNMPQAIDHALLRPYIGRSISFLYLPFALELLLIGVLLIICLLFRKKNEHLTPVCYCCLFFGLSMLLVIGYTIPILGAIVRYRSIYFIFMLLPVLITIDWKRLKYLIINKNM